MGKIEQFRPKDKGSLSILQKVRLDYVPKVPIVLQAGNVQVVVGDATAPSDAADRPTVSHALPLTYGQPLLRLVDSADAVGSKTTMPKTANSLRVGLVFCARQAPGGHNVVAGVFDALVALNQSSSLFGFIDGTEGLFSGNYIEVTKELLSLYRNQGGYDMLGRSKDEIASVEQVKAAKETCESLKLDAIVLVGGPETATHAAHLAESFAASHTQTKVLTVPATIDGDIRNQFVESSVGFDTACKVYSQLISNICIDALSAEKYYYFIRLMGRQASHITLECALQSHPNLVVLGEEVALSKSTLFDVTNQICDLITSRSQQGKHHGVILLPEGLIEHIPEVHALLAEINELIKQGVKPEAIEMRLSPWAAALFQFLPSFIRSELVEFRESSGSVRLSMIESEKLFLHLVEEEMARRTKSGAYKGKKFNGISYFFGYQARGSLPSNFDSDYAYALGHTAVHLAAAGASGYMAVINNLKDDSKDWLCGGVPITAMMSVKRWLRGPGIAPLGKPAVNFAKVDLKGAPFNILVQNAADWKVNDAYRNPGPLQFEGPSADSRTITLMVEDHDYMDGITKLHSYLDQVREMVKPGCSPESLKAALSSLASVTQVLTIMNSPSFQAKSAF